MSSAGPTSNDFPLPVRDRSALTLVGHTRAAMQAWVDSLPLINTAESGKLLYQTTTELGQLAIDADLRFELLEILHPSIHKLIDTLEKHLLNQPLRLPVAGRRALALAQALRRNLALNYEIVAVDTLRKLQGRVGFMNLGRKNAQAQAATAIVRTIAELRALLLDSYYQYEDIPAGVWRDLHKLVRVADTQGLSDLPIRAGDQTLSVRRAYLAAVVLAASQLNRLRQAEMELVFRHSLAWGDLLTLDRQPEGAILVCNLDDRAPCYARWTQTTAESWYVHARALVEHFQRQLSQPDGTLPLSLLTHLHTIWSTSHERLFERAPCRKHTLLCLGMSSVHYYAGGQTEFTVVVRGEEKKREIKLPEYLFGLDEGEVLEEQPDAWQVCYGTVKAIEDEPAPEALPAVPELTYMPYRVVVENRSPGGYGLIWTEDPPAALRPGELVGISEQRGSDWGIGVVHWLRQTARRSFQAGVELLAAHPQTCGICLVRDGQQASDYLRAILIPEMVTLGRPASVIVSSTSLTAHSQVRIILKGQEVLAQLTRQVLATPSVSQFEFALVTTGAPVADALDPDDPEALWAQL